MNMPHFNAGDRPPQFPHAQLRNKMIVPFFTSLAAGAQVTFSTSPQFDVDVWCVAVGCVAGIKVTVTLGPAASQSGLQLNGGGYIKNYPGDGDSISLQNVGAVTAYVMAIATRGYRDVEIYPGSLA